MGLTDKQKSNYRIIADRNRKQEERLRRNRLASNVVSVSSNSKWQKIFDWLAAQIDRQAKCRIKLLKQDESRETEDILGSVFEDTYIDGLDGGSINYSEIEWIEIACSVVPSFDFKVDMEVGDDFVVIYGYQVE